MSDTGYYTAKNIGYPSLFFINRELSPVVWHKVIKRRYDEKNDDGNSGVQGEDIVQ